MDKLTNNLSHSIRGLREVQTDDKGRKLIGAAITDIRALWQAQEKWIAQLDMDNMQLGLALTHEQRIEREHYLLKGALKNMVALDELVDEYKKLTTKN